MRVRASLVVPTVHTFHGLGIHMRMSSLNGVNSPLRCVHYHNRIDSSSMRIVHPFEQAG